MSKYALGLCLLALSSVGFGATLVSTQSIFSDPNQVFEQSFLYNPAVQGGTIIIQTYGYGGSANGSIVANTGQNLAGNIVSTGGFDPIIGLFAGAAGGGGARVDFNDDGVCGPNRGESDLGLCFDSTIVISGLAVGTYTVSLSVFPNFPPTTEFGPYPGGPATFGMGRSSAFAFDAAAVPEPLSFGLVGGGFLGLGLLRLRLKK
jgi:hypothetical protein